MAVIPRGIEAYLSDDADEEDEITRKESDDRKKRIVKSHIQVKSSIASTSMMPSEIAQKRRLENDNHEPMTTASVKRQKLLNEPAESLSNSRTPSRHISSRSQQRRFWTSGVAAAPSLAMTASTTAFVSKSVLPIDTAGSSRSSSRTSIRTLDPSVNLFSVPPKTPSGSEYGNLNSSRASSALNRSVLSRSRPSSMASNSSTTSASTFDYRKILGYNSETKRILKDLERAAGMTVGTPSVNPSNRTITDSGVIAGRPFIANAASKVAGLTKTIPITTPVSTVAKDAQPEDTPRLASLGPSILHKSTVDHAAKNSNHAAQNGQPKNRASSVLPSSNWLVTSKPVFRFAKPYPVVDTKEKNGPSIFRFGAPAPIVSSVKVNVIPPTPAATPASSFTSAHHLKQQLRQPPNTPAVTGRFNNPTNIPAVTDRIDNYFNLPSSQQSLKSNHSSATATNNVTLHSRGGNLR